MSPRIESPGPRDLDAKSGGAGEPPTDFVDRFAATMPVRYRVLFDPRAIRKHANVAFRRASGAADVDAWRTLPDGTTALCVVADDRPGLLLLIAAVLASHRLSVMTALLFSRPGFDAREAVNLFWVRREGDQDHVPLAQDEVLAIRETLEALLAGRESVHDVAPQTPLASVEDAAASVVRFEDKDDEGCAVLTVEAKDAPALLLLIAQTLFTHGAQIVRSLVRTVDGRVHNRFDLVEVDGAIVPPKRRASIRAAVAAALAQRAVRTGS